MKKILLFGTMLGMASAALAFGGVFSHGSKSSTYKGGVDAIGVHFGGEKKTTDTKPVTNTCGDGTPCGDGCCQLDNVCQQNESGEYQCCDKDLETCCPVNQGVYTYDDWSMGYPPQKVNACCDGTIYCKQDAEGNCIEPPSCCPKEKTVHGPFEQTSGEQWYLCCNAGAQTYCPAQVSYGWVYACCNNGIVHKGVGANGTDVCCHEEQELTCVDEDENGNCLVQYCCPSDRTPYCAYRDSEGNCTGSSCCTGPVTKRSGPNMPDLCE